MTHPLTFKSPRLTLAGMMGSGKSTLGKLLAEILGWRHIDTDQLIIERSGKSIAALFADEGEAHFRRLEQQVVAEVISLDQVVISSGGGMMMDPRNRESLTRNTLTVHLNVSVATALERLTETQDRPLLEPDPENNLRNIHRDRQPVYAELPVQIETDQRHPNEIAREILTHLVSKHRILHDGGFTVHAGLNLAERVALLIEEGNYATPVILLIDEAVWLAGGQSWVNQVKSACDHQFQIIPLAADEERKSLDTVQDLWSRLLTQGIQRDSAILVVGGGVLGDLGGFVASTLLRGVGLLQVPTTLLAQVDAAIGGKTGINFNQSKNMIGTFYPAKHTLLDPLFLMTLPDREFNCGLAEMVKAALLGDADFFVFLENNLSDIHRKQLSPLLKAIEWSARIKLEIVAEDLHDQSGRRALLNLGHTFAHALESVSRYDLRHGEAVAIGMVLATRFAVHSGFCDAAVLDRLKAVLRQCKLPVDPPKMKFSALVKQMKFDKKRAGSQLNLIIPTQIGAAKSHPVTAYDDLLVAFQKEK